eukprot:5080562-Pleurochrysis_carterae.AAC.1
MVAIESDGWSSATYGAQTSPQQHTVHSNSLLDLARGIRRHWTWCRGERTGASARVTESHSHRLQKGCHTALRTRRKHSARGVESARLERAHAVDGLDAQALDKTKARGRTDGSEHVQRGPRHRLTRKGAPAPLTIALGECSIASLRRGTRKGSGCAPCTRFSGDTCGLASQKDDSSRHACRNHKEKRGQRGWQIN